MNQKVSIVTPAYNCERYIGEMIESVIAQTYDNWELIIVNDCSLDRTAQVAEGYASKNPKIKVFNNKKNLGVSATRNRAYKYISGRYVAFLDADDIWNPDKLEKQVKFMKEKDSAFSCTAYEIVANDGTSLNKNMHVAERLNYDGFLKNNLIQIVSVMVDISKVDLSILHMPVGYPHEDAIVWLNILKHTDYCHGLDEVLCKYRRSETSISRSTFNVASGMWYVYRHVENLPVSYAVFCFFRYAALAVWKRIYF